MPRKISWRRRVPKTKFERLSVKKRCGTRCFLIPKTLGFPVCSKRSCKPDCRGLRAAYARARQTGRASVARKALRIACLRCSWTERHKRC